MKSPAADTDRARPGKCPPVPSPTTREGPRAVPDPRRRAIAELYRTHADFVVRIAGHLGVPPGAVDDVVHDVFIVAHRRFTEFDENRGTPRSWLYGVTRRVVMHHQRAAARHVRRLHAVPDPVADTAPDEAVARLRAAALVDAFLASLPEDRRLVFALTDIEGMSAVEVARALDCNLNTVYGRLRAARLAFAGWVDALEHEGQAKR